METHAPRFIVDANLPFRIRVFHSSSFVSARDLGLAQDDNAIWKYAIRHGLTVITRDTDFYNRLIRYGAPPKLIWFRVHYQSFKQTANFLNEIWPQIEGLTERFDLVEIFNDEIKGSISSSLPPLYQ